MPKNKLTNNTKKNYKKPGDHKIQGYSLELSSIFAKYNQVQQVSDFKGVDESQRNGGSRPVPPSRLYVEPVVGHRDCTAVRCPAHPLSTNYKRLNVIIDI